MDKTRGADEFDELIQSLYALAATHEWSDFRQHALGEVGRRIGATGAAWLTQSSVGVFGEFTVFPAQFGLSGDQVMAWSAAQGSVVQEAAMQTLRPIPDNLKVAGEPAAASVFAQRYPHRRSDLSSELLLYLPAGVEPPPLLARVIGHLVEASRLSLQQYIQRDEWLVSLGRTNRGASAIVDLHGSIYAAAQSFRDLVAPAGNREFTALPFKLPAGIEQGQDSFLLGPLHFRVKRLGNLFQLHARRPLPLDHLSPREQQIARALGDGKTFKSVARQYDIAVSTVANHASRIYRKLGVYRREELVNLVRKPQTNAPPATHGNS